MPSLFRRPLFLGLCVVVCTLWGLLGLRRAGQDRDQGALSWAEVSVPEVLVTKPSEGLRRVRLEDLPAQAQAAARARSAARALAERKSGLAVLDEFHLWARDYLQSGKANQAEMLKRGVELAQARRAEMKGLIRRDARLALEVFRGHVALSGDGGVTMEQNWQN